MIRKLVLKNWKCHLNSSFEFALGTNALLGVMGAGKSSVLDAISFALFGTFPALQQRKIKLEDVIMKKPVKKEFAEIELEFDFNGNVYNVKRRIERKKATQAELRINGRLVEAQPQRVNEFIQDIIKMDFDLFTRAIYSEQNRIDAFLILPKGQRIKKIDEILKLERFEQARATTVSLINRFKSHLFELTRFISTLRGEISEEDLKKMKEEMRKIKNELNILENDIKFLEKELNEIEKERETLLDLRKRKENLEKLAHSLQAEINLLENQITEITLPPLEEIRKDISKIKEKIESLEKEFYEIREKVEKAKKEEEKTRFELKQIEENRRKAIALKREKEEIEEKVKGMEDLEKQIEENKNSLEEKRKKFFITSSKIKELEKSLEELSKAKENCPVCDSKLNEEKRKVLMEKKKRELEKSRNVFSLLGDEIRKLQNEISVLEKKLFLMKGYREKIKMLESEIKELEKSLEKEDELKEKIKMLEKKISFSQEEKNKLEEEIKETKVEFEKKKILEKEVLEVERKKKEIELKKKKLKEIKTELEKIRNIFSEEKLEKIIEESKRVFGELNSKKTKIIELKKQEKEREKAIEAMERKLKDLEKYERERKRVEEIISDLEKLKEALHKTQTELRKNFISAVNQAMQAIWEELYPYGDFQNIRLHISEGDYVLQLQELDGSWVNVEHVSGGERTLAALTLRIAFALVLAPQLRWLILDEPTHNLDIKAREELARVLRERIIEFIDQVFLITHDPILEDAVSGMLYRIERDKKKNDVARVIRVEER